MVRKHRAPKGALRPAIANSPTHSGLFLVRKHRAPKGALRHVKKTYMGFPLLGVRKHRAPKGALRRWSSSSRGRFLSCQKAPSPKRCIKTAPSRCAQVEVPARQKAPRVKRCITTRCFANLRRDQLRPEPAPTQPRPPRQTRGGLVNVGQKSTYERKPASLFDGCLLSSPFHQGIHAR